MGKAWRQIVASNSLRWAAAGSLLGGLLLLAESAACWFYDRLLVNEFYRNALLIYPLAGAVLGWLGAVVPAGSNVAADARLKFLPLLFLWLQGALLHRAIGLPSWKLLLAVQLVWLGWCLAAGWFLSRLDWRGSSPWPWLGWSLLYPISAFGLACGALGRDLQVGGGWPLLQVFLEGGLVCLLFALASRISRWRLRAVRPGIAWVAAMAVAALAGAVAAGPRVFSGPSTGSLAAVSRSEANIRAPASRPNIVVMVVDTLRADRLSSYGYGRLTSPNLDHFASRGTLYRRAYSPGNWTLPAHASLFTGRFPRSHGAHRSGLGAERADVFPLDEAEVTLAEILDARGYRTGAIVANHLWVRQRYGLAQGFDDWVAQPPSSSHLLAQAGRWLQRHTLQHRLSWVSELAWKSLRHPVRRAPEINRMALRWLDQRTSRAPFLLFLNYMDVHSPRRPPAPFRDLFPGRLDETADVKSGLRNGSLKSSPALRRHLDSQYDGSVAYWDHHFGRLTASLQDRGVLDKTLFVITSDHGEYLGEDGLIEHEVGVGEAMTHVPLIVRWPGADAGRVVEEQVQLTDVLPTVLDVLGLPSHQAVQGRRLGPGGQVSSADCPTPKVQNGYQQQTAPNASADGPCEVDRALGNQDGTVGAQPTVSDRRDEDFDAFASLGRPAYLQHFGEHRIAHWFEGRFRFDQRALRAGPWTLIVSDDGSRQLVRGGDGEGPSEDLSQRFPALAQELLRRLHQLESVCKPAPARQRSISPEAEEALRSLGYL